MKRMIHLLTCLLAAIFLLGCGGADISKEKSLKDRAMDGTSDDYTPITSILGDTPLDTAGLDDTDTGQGAAATNTTVAQDKDFVGGHMAVFLPTVVANGEEIKAFYKIVTADDQANLVMEGIKAGQEVEVTPGTYDIVFTTKAIAGEPSLTLRGVELVQGRRIHRKVKFPVGEITLVTAGGGCRAGKIQLKLKDTNEWLPGKYSTCKPIKLMAGEYVGKQGHTEIKGITVYDGGTRKISIRGQ